jgi:ubiquinone/menaquinone biosynthesis C-methylase UbiE
MNGRLHYPAEPADKEAYTRHNDRLYGRLARLYDLVVRALPLWSRWIERPLPDIVGPRVLELSFGTGHLLSRYAHRYQTWAIDYNWRMAQVAREKLPAGPDGTQPPAARLLLADVEGLPFADRCFDTVLCTMAFTGYPDGPAAMVEIDRVLRPGGRLLLVDVNFPSDGNRPGMWAARAWIAFGDILRDMGALFEAYGFSFSDEEIGGFGTVHYYLAQKELARKQGTGKPPEAAGEAPLP